MDVLFLDTNVLFSVAYREDSSLLRLWHLDDVDLVTSEYALEEANRNLESDEQRTRLYGLGRSVRRVGEAPDRSLPSGLDLPDKDVPIFLAAAAARATHLITGDFTHFGPYYGRVVEGMRILPPGAYLRARLR